MFEDLLDVHVTILLLSYLNFEFLISKLVPWDTAHDLERHPCRGCETDMVLYCLLSTDRTQMVSQKVFFNQRGVADINMRTICQQLDVPRKMTSLAPARPPSKVINTVNYFHCKCQVTLCTFSGDLTLVTLAGRLRDWHRFAVFILTLRCSRDWIERNVQERNVDINLTIHPHLKSVDFLSFLSGE